jgi:CHAT domain-containing protein
VPFASLEAVQRALDEQEVMVWFSIAPWKDVYEDFGGGAWAITVTRHRATAHALSAGDTLDAQVAALLGQLRDRGTSPQAWAPAARRLGQTLLGDALTNVSPAMTHLIIVTDGALHRMPFEMLSLQSGPMLGERFEISEVPSATLWMRMRQSQTASTGRGVLVFADPDVLQSHSDTEIRLAPLPGARREAQAIARILDLEPHHLAQGPDASERFVKTAPLQTVGVLHVAAHARADAVFPERSAVFLAPGHPGEDGWLQPNEIAELDLRGRLVVLSACDSAEGSLLSGEGPLSLARAFFSAGARAVVATRWPLRDDDAAFVMDRFYRALSDGRSVAAALRRARLDVIDAGLPAAVWAGIAALGDGRHQPIAARERRPVLARSLGAVAIAIAIGSVVWIRYRLRRH